MRIRRIGFIGTLALGLLAEPSVAEAQEAIFLVRHTEQAGPGRTDPPLTEVGQRRAKVLAEVLKDTGIDVIFVTKKRRTAQTGEPIAKALNVKIKAHSTRRDIDGLLARLHAEHSQDRVLIISHSRSIPGLLKAFGHPVKVKIERFEYDNLFIIIPQSKGEPQVLRLRYGE